MSEHYIYDSRWILSNELFTKSARFSLKPYQSDYSDFSLRWNWNYLPAGVAKPVQGPDRTIRLEANNIPAFQAEDYMPPENELKSRVDFIYSDELLENDFDKYWKKKGKKWNDRVEGFIGKRKAMDDAVAQIVAPSDPPEVKLQKIYARVQKLRNTSYEVRKTEQEEKRDNEKNPTNVEDVWKRGYGNGWELTWLFLALVRSAGIEAHPVVVSDRREYFFNPKSMDGNKLNANVVQVVMNGKTLYFDPGGAFTPFGQLPWWETGVAGLRLDKDGGAWITTTMPQSSDSQIQRVADLKLMPDTGALEGNVTLTFTGIEAMSRRVEERNEDDTARKIFLEDALREYVPAACEVKLTNQPDWSSSDSPLAAEFTLKIPGWASAAGHRALVPVGIFSASERHLFDHTVRVYPIYIEFPYQEVDDITVELPAGWQVGSLPPVQSHEGQVIGYTIKAEGNKNSVHLTRRLNINFGLLETKLYLPLRSFFEMVRAGDEEQVVLQPGVATASN